MSEQFKSALERKVDRIEADLGKLEKAVEDVVNVLLSLRAVMEAVAEKNDQAE